MSDSSDSLNVDSSNVDSLNVTLLLGQWRGGDQAALDALVPLIYQELRQLASAQLRRDPKASIQCTELVAEAYLRLVDASRVPWQDRTHFFSVAARTMRRVLVDNYRAKSTDKRGQNKTLITFDDELGQGSGKALELDRLDDVLTDLEKLDARQAEIVTLRFFGGLTNEEIGQVLEISERTVKREWAMVRLWLFKHLSETEE